MASLHKPISPFFPNPILLFEPIYNNLVDIDFGENVLNENCFKIKGNIAHIHNNYDNIRKKSTSQIIESLINTNLPKVIFNYHDKNGEVLEQIIVCNFKFIKIINKLDFNWNENTLKKLKVQFEYDKTFHSEKEYNSYIRKEKLNKINGRKD